MKTVTGSFLWALLLTMPRISVRVEIEVRAFSTWTPTKVGTDALEVAFQPPKITERFQYGTNLKRINLSKIKSTVLCT